MDKLKGRVKRGCQIKTNKVQSANGHDIMGCRTTEAERGKRRAASGLMYMSGSPGPLGFPAHILEGSPSCAGTCHSKHGKCCCLRGITIRLANWKLAGTKAAGGVGAFAEIQINLGPGHLCGQPCGPKG